ncbi:UNVERIFIED_CONTAM: hypothetical protein HDU68_006613, partial [Siphonaria sp. JEL0065]
MCNATTTVTQPNQSCVDVIKNYTSVSISLLSRWNPGINCWSIPVNSKVCVAGDVPPIPIAPVRVSSSNSLLANAANGIQNAVGQITITGPSSAAIPTRAPVPGSVSSWIGEAAFSNAMQACGVGKKDLYKSMVAGFNAPISGLKELAILLGNCAHESAKFTTVEETLCKNSQCAYGWWYGRGYLQLTWEQNYIAAAKVLGIPAIHDNPSIITTDENVNWATVQYFWTTEVQWRLNSYGMSLASSVLGINPKFECASSGGGKINDDRASMTYCFEQQFGVKAEYETY